MIVTGDIVLRKSEYDTLIQAVFVLYRKWTCIDHFIPSIFSHSRKKTNPYDTPTYLPQRDRTRTALDLLIPFLDVGRASALTSLPR